MNDYSERIWSQNILLESQDILSVCIGFIFDSFGIEAIVLELFDF